jgi:hypothetical protein
VVRKQNKNTILLRRPPKHGAASSTAAAQAAAASNQRISVDRRRFSHEDMEPVEIPAEPYTTTKTTVIAINNYNNTTKTTVMVALTHARTHPHKQQLLSLTTTNTRVTFINMA